MKNNLAYIHTGMSLQYSLDRGLGGPQNQSGRHGEEKNLAPTGTQQGEFI
jgi:hypothetical protein